MFVLAYILALQGIFVCCHMVKSESHSGIEAGQMHMEQNIIDEGGLSLELHRSLAFYPSTIDFGAWSVGTARSHMVTLVNKNLNRSLYLNSISGKTPAFYSSFFEDKVVPPQGNTTFNVVFLPRSYGQVETNLMIHTSFGQAKLPVKGSGKECPYRLRPLVGIKAPFNATINPEIHMYNPHKKPIQILEIYSSGGQFQLELPSGGQEGPQALWEIPPYTTKPIIRIRFHGSQPGNHTAYIRIKISGTDQEDEEENILVIPVEFEILGHHGIYSPNPVIDFGRLTTSDGIRMIKVNLTNSGKEKMEILEYRLNNVNNLIDFKRSNFTLTLNTKQAKDNVTIISGELVIKSQTKQIPKQKREYSVEIKAEIFKGTMKFKKNTTMFVTKGKNYTKGDRDFFVANLFAVPIAISNVSVDVNDSSIFKLTNFTPVIIKPGQKTVIFKIAAVNETANFITPLKIKTNLSTYEFPVVVCTGLLKRYTSIDSFNLTKLPDERTLDYGVVQIGAQSLPGLILMKNPNPIPIQLLRWNFTNPREVYYQSMFLGCLKPTFSLNSTAAEKFNFCLNLPPGEVAAFQLIVESYTVKSFNGVFKIWTEFEEIHTKVKFVSLQQSLTIDQSKLQLKDCFPGKRCTAAISVQSTFVKPMIISSFHVSVPGLVVEYRTQNGLPEIAAKGVTNVGHIHFDPKSVCLKKCYIQQEADNDPINLKFDESELNRRRDMFRKLKWSLKQITFTLNTTAVRFFEFNTTVDIIWPKLVKGIQTFPVVEVGQTYNGLIYIKNPASQPIRVEISLSDPKKARTTNLKDLPSEVLESCTSCYLTDEDLFILDGETEQIIEANSVAEVLVRFVAQEAGVYSTLLHIRNNLTLYEAVWITAKTVQPQFKFGNRKPGSQTPILFEITEKHLTNCEEDTEPKEMIIVSTKRTLTARNTGEVPIFVETFLIDDRYCEGYGFKIVDCSSFNLYANSSKKIDIVFTPDFTMTRISRPLILRTNLSYAVNYTLLATLPRHSVERCAKASSRPEWEGAMKKCSVGMLSVAFIFVLIASFFDSEKVLKDHVINLSKEKGPVQPPLDLRNIALKNSSPEESQVSNGSISQDKFLKNVNTSARKRNPKRSSVGPQILPNREKTWAEELAKKLGSVSKKTEQVNFLQISPNSLTLPVVKTEISPPIGNTKPREDKQSPPKKSISKEKESSESPSEKSPMEKLINAETEKKDIKIETAQQVEIKKPKMSFKKTKSAPIPLTATQNEVKEKSETVTTGTNTSDSPDRGIERSQKSQKYPKEKSEVLEKRTEQVGKKSDHKLEIEEKKYEQVEKKLDQVEKKPEQIEKKSIPIQTEPPKSPVHSLTEIPTQTDITPPIKQNTRKYGKTPGRERKKEPTMSKRLDRKPLKYKGNAFQFSAPLPTSCSSVWDPNQASFSHVVSQKLSDVNGTTSTGTPTSILEQPDASTIEHDWNEADLKNNETFGPDSDIKRSSMDLGPIGTKKSPSSTPVWEPLPAALHRPTPNISSSSNSSFFSSNFPIASNLEYSSDNQYLGGASGLLDHLITESQQQRRWQTNEVLLSLLQQRDRNVVQNNWEVDNRAWTPMGYQNNGSSVLPDPLDVWQTGTSIRPPPGLGASKGDSPNRLSQPSSSNLCNEENIEPIQRFDPFSSLSSIWSETWTKKNNNNT